MKYYIRTILISIFIAGIFSILAQQPSSDNLKVISDNKIPDTAIITEINNLFRSSEE